jgi:RNA polymerase sigma factor (TIGR02999 family)
MRRVLVEHARQRLSQKRGAGALHEPLDKAIAVALEPDLNVVEMDDALKELAASDPQSAQVVELRYFGGLSIEEAAEAMDVSPSTMTRLWNFARAWLYRRLSARSDCDEGPADNKPD